MTSDVRSDGGPDGADGGVLGLRATTAVTGLLDGPDRAIVTALQRDGRRPYGAIAQDVGLSEAAVRRRVQRLRERGVVRIVALTDLFQLGLQRQAMVGIRADGDVRRVASRVGALEGVGRVVLCTGSFDVLAEVACEDDERLLALLNGSIRSVPGVRSTETFLYLDRPEQFAAWEGG